MTKLSVYLDPSLAVTSVHPDVLQLLLSQKRSVDAWSSILCRLSSLDKEEALLLVDTMTSVEVWLKDL